jgi:hypothetical protein
VSGTAPDLILDLSVPQGVPGALGAFQAKTAAYTILGTDGTVSVDTTSGAVTLTLPGAAANSGKWLLIVKTGGANALTIQRAGSDTLLPSSGTRTSVAFPSDCAYGELMRVSTSTAWLVASGQASDQTVGSRSYRWEQARAAASTTAAVGWGLVSYDSGARNVLSLVVDPQPSGLSVTKLTLRRIGIEITLGFTIAATSSQDAVAILAAATPTGFAPSGDQAGIAAAEIPRTASLTIDAQRIRLWVHSTSGIKVGASGATGGAVSGCVKWDASATLPASLPGTAV